jgi:hypothetical protein
MSRQDVAVKNASGDPTENKQLRQWTMVKVEVPLSEMIGA